MMPNLCQICQTAPGASHVRTLGTNKWLVQLIDVRIRGLPNGLHFFDELCPVIQTSHKIASTTMWYEPDPLQIGLVLLQALCSTNNFELK